MGRSVELNDGGTLSWRLRTKWGVYKSLAQELLPLGKLTYIQQTWAAIQPILWAIDGWSPHDTHKRRRTIH